MLNLLVPYILFYLDFKVIIFGFWTAFLRFTGVKLADILIIVNQKPVIKNKINKFN